MTPQELNLELIRAASFNSLDGNQVVDTLEQHRSLWRAALIDSHGLVKLRDLPDGRWNVDTLYILPVEGKEDQLLALTSDWGADSVKWLGGENGCSALGEWSNDLRANPCQILELWWD